MPLPPEFWEDGPETVEVVLRYTIQIDGLTVIMNGQGIGKITSWTHRDRDEVHLVAALDPKRPKDLLPGSVHATSMNCTLVPCPGDISRYQVVPPSLTFGPPPTAAPSTTVALVAPAVVQIVVPGSPILFHGMPVMMDNHEVGQVLSWQPRAAHPGATEITLALNPSGPPVPLSFTLECYQTFAELIRKPSERRTP